MSKNKAPIEEEVKAEDILDQILEGEMKVTPKKLWAIAPKLCIALKEILMSKHSIQNESNTALAVDEIRPQQNLVSVDRLENSRMWQESVEIKDSKCYDSL